MKKKARGRHCKTWIIEGRDGSAYRVTDLPAFCALRGTSADRLRDYYYRSRKHGVNPPFFLGYRIKSKKEVYKRENGQ